MRGQLWQDCRCGTEPVCVDCERCERHCVCADRAEDARERQELNALASDRPAAPGEWEAYRASSACPRNHQEALDSIPAMIAAGRQTRAQYDQRRREFEAELYTMHAEGQYDVLRYMELEKVVNVIREFLGLSPFDGEGALTSRLARYGGEFAP